MKNIYLIGWNNRMNNDVKSIIITSLLDCKDCKLN